MPTHVAASALPLLLAALTGALAGLLGGALFAGGRMPAPPVAAAPELAPLLEELRGLRQDLRAGTAAGAGVTATGAIDRQVATPAPPTMDTAQLAATVADLVRAVEALATRADALGAQQAAGRGVLEQVARRSGPDVQALVALAKAVSDDYEGAQAAWMFLPATEVLRRFGRPKRIGAGKGGLQWEYEFEAEGKGWWLGFTIADGVVVRID
ncbi:MAG: hypothetical protein JNM25_13585 [Planctomycetes bacterium]|nr:hypothetical protein [Planctomycetota bacterium]